VGDGFGWFAGRTKVRWGNAGVGVGDFNGDGRQDFAAASSDVVAIRLGTCTSPATFTVTNLLDSGPGSLRQAILNANANSPAADTINFQAGLTGTITLTSGQMIVSDSLTINGPGANVISVSGNNASRIFQFNSGQTVSLSGLTLTAGSVGGMVGGAVLSTATATISNVIIYGNSASDGGGVASSGTGTMTISNSVVANNSASSTGGGLRSFSGRTIITDSTFSGNTADIGGALNLQGSNATLINSTISGNTTSRATTPAAILFAVSTESRTLEVVNSTIANNITSTPNTVGGILVVGGGPGVSSTLTLRNSIMANNGSINLLAFRSGSGMATITSQGYNLISDNGAGFLTGTGDQINTNPRLGPLADNGGPTPTHALLAGSPALDKGSNAGSGVTTDQRGLTRPTDLVAAANAPGGDGSDIGAYEQQGPPLTVTGTSRNEGDSAQTPFTFTVVRSGPLTAFGATLNYATVGSTAVDPSDFTPLSGVINFEPNETTKRFTVLGSGDTQVEPDETFRLRVTLNTNGVITQAEGVSTIVNDDFGTASPTPTPTPSSRVEGDVVNDTGGAAGDNNVLANDVTIIRQMVLNNIAGPSSAAQFQAADTNGTLPNQDPLTVCGNGAIDAGDVTITSNYNLRNLPIKPACGPTGPVATLTEMFGPSGVTDPLSPGRIIRAESATTNAGRLVTIAIQIDSQGDEAAASYTIDFPAGVLTYVSSDLGTGAPAGSNLGTNINHLAEGRLGVLVDAVEPYRTGTRQMLTVTFAVAPGAAGTFPIGFSSATTPQGVAAAVDGRMLTTTFEPGSLVIRPAAAGLTVSGRVITNDGRGVRNATVTITGPDGTRRSAVTGSFGFYTFESVEPGQTYIIAVSSRRFRFAPHVVTPTDSLTDVDFVGLE